METYTIVPRAGAYRVEAATEDGRRRLVATYPTEQAAILRLKALQAEADQVVERQLRDWRV
jgi:hypothetical protein